MQGSDSPTRNVRFSAGTCFHLQHANKWKNFAKRHHDGRCCHCQHPSRKWQPSHTLFFEMFTVKHPTNRFSLYPFWEWLLKPCQGLHLKLLYQQTFFSADQLWYWKKWLRRTGWKRRMIRGEFGLMQKIWGCVLSADSCQFVIAKKMSSLFFICKKISGYKPCFYLVQKTKGLI